MVVDLSFPFMLHDECIETGDVYMMLEPLCLFYEYLN